MKNSTNCCFHVEREHGQTFFIFFPHLVPDRLRNELKKKFIPIDFSQTEQKQSSAKQSCFSFVEVCSGNVLLPGEVELSRNLVCS